MGVCRHILDDLHCGHVEDLHSMLQSSVEDADIRQEVEEHSVEQHSAAGPEASVGPARDAHTGTGASADAARPCAQEDSGDSGEGYGDDDDFEEDEEAC